MRQRRAGRKRRKRGNRRRKNVGIRQQRRETAVSRSANVDIQQDNNNFVFSVMRAHKIFNFPISHDNCATSACHIHNPAPSVTCALMTPRSIHRDCFVRHSPHYRSGIRQTTAVRRAPLLRNAPPRAGRSAACQPSAKPKPFVS